LTQAAHLRSSPGYKTPDAIQLATAQSAQATFFLTHDEALLSAFGLKVVVLKDLQPTL
jgi:predicted nucleic acid-binding protein